MFMNKQKLWGKLLKGALAVSLVTSITVPSIVKNTDAVYADTVAGITPFVDIPAGLYAEKHIYRLSLQGIVNGYLDNQKNTYSFKYNNSISREEAVIMAIRFAGLTGELDTNAIIEFPAGFTVKSDYKAYIDLAFKKGLLDEKEEYAVAAEKPEQAWGSAPASREWVTKLIVRTIGQQQLADTLANVEPNFYDKAIIDKRYLAYVNAAVQLGLVKGVTETTFQPQLAINRASFSTILSRAQKDFPVKHQNQVEGILLSQTDNSITIFANGTEQTLAVDASTGFYIANNDFAILKTQLVQYGKISVISLNGVAKFVEMQSTEQQVTTKEYEVLIVNTASNKLTVNDNNSAKEISIATSTRFADSEGAEIKLADIKKGDKVQVLQPTYANDLAPLRVVRVLKGQVGNAVKGKLFDVSERSVTVIIDGEYVTKPLARNPKVTIPNLDNATVDSLLKGTDEVTLTLNDIDQVIEIKVDNRNITSFDYAKLVSLNTTDKILTVSKDRGIYATKITDNTRIYVDGNEVAFNNLGVYAGWNNISVDFVSVPVDVEKNVYEYQIVRLDFHSDITGKLVSVDQTNKVINMELTTGEKFAIPFNTIVIEHPTKQNLTDKDLVVGNTYSFVLETSAMSLNRVVLEETMSAKVSYVYTSNGEIILQYMGNTQTVNANNIKLIKANGQAATINDVKMDSAVTVVFKGYAIKSVILP